MAKLGLESEIVDRSVYARSVERFRDAGIVLPTFSQLADPATLPDSTVKRLASVDPTRPEPLNLFRLHWNNTKDWSLGAVPQFLELPSALTGVRARIVLLLGDSFPMIEAHKVLAAYGCLAPRVVTGQFDPVAHRAIWPSTGNYCRGGVAISRLLNCHGVAVLPAGMSVERFEWLERWVLHRDDIIRTPGTESNVKEIYDKCNELEADGRNVIFNQFSEFGNYLVHLEATGRAAERVFEALRTDSPGLRLAGWVSATGSAGTLAAGDYLKERHGARITAVEALECPTLSANGFGEHNIQGIGDKHVPFIHNVMNTDFVAAVSDRSTDALYALFAGDEGKRYLADRKAVPAATIDGLRHLGLSSIANVLGAVKVARYLNLGSDDLMLTVATDGAALYGSEGEKILARDFPSGLDSLAAAETFGRHMLGAGTDNTFELSTRDRERIFNLGYFTWVEQQGVALEDFVARRRQSFWRGLRELIPVWDSMIEEFNRAVAARPETGTENGGA